MEILRAFHYYRPKMQRCSELKVPRMHLRVQLNLNFD